MILLKFTEFKKSSDDHQCLGRTGKINDQIYFIHCKFYIFIEME